MFELLKDTISIGYSALNRTLPINQDKETALLYHSIADTDILKGDYKINIYPSIFKKHIKHIKNINIKNLTLTFDDGYENFFEIAFPLLREYNIKVILFITVGFIGGAVSAGEIFKINPSLKPLSWRQVKEIAQAGIEIGSHSQTHPVLSMLDNKSARAEIADSKKEIEDIIGKKVKYFAYPFGSSFSFNNKIKEIVKNSGYERAYTNIMGFNYRNSDAYELKRIRIYSNDNLFRFKLKLSGGYNWVDRFRRK